MAAMIWLRNVIIVEGRIKDFARQFRNGLKQVGTRYDADKLICAHNRQPLDVMAPSDARLLAVGNEQKGYDFKRRPCLG
jgi:hypothetical protein